MHRFLVLYISLSVLLGYPLAGAQSVPLEHPEDIHAQTVPSARDMQSRVANVQLQKDAKELSELCSAIPADMDGLKKGLLQKDLVEKLKRVEKLSKRVREELTR